MRIFRDIVDKDYKDIIEWWKDWGFPVMTKNSLSRNGYIVEEDGNNICACWLFFTSNSLFCTMAYPICNKKVDYKSRCKALDFLLEEIKSIAIKNNNPIIFTTVERGHLKSRLEKHGFLKGDESVDQFFYSE